MSRSAVCCPRSGAGALAGWLPSNEAGSPGARYSPTPGWCIRVNSGLRYHPVVGGAPPRMSDTARTTRSWRTARRSISVAECSANHVANKPGKDVAIAIAVAFGAEVGRQRVSERGHRRAGAGNLTRSRKCLPVNATTMNETPSLLVKSWPYCPKMALPRRGRLGAVDLRLGEEPRLPADGERDVLQRQADVGAVPAAVAAQHGRGHGERGVQAAAHIPGRQHVVDRAGMIRADR